VVSPFKNPLAVYVNLGSASLNAAAALFVAGKTKSLMEGWNLAVETVDSGLAKAKLAELTNAAQSERLFFTALYQRDLRDLAKLTASLNEQLLGVVQRRFNAGQGAPAELCGVLVAHDLVGPYFQPPELGERGVRRVRGRDDHRVLNQVRHAQDDPLGPTS